MTRLHHKLKSAIHLASLSPSSHNCQPWGLTYVCSDSAKVYLDNFTLNQDKSTSYLVLFLDRNRCLSTLSAHRQEMLLSCGAFLESLFIGLLSQNLSAKIVWVNEKLENDPFFSCIDQHEDWLPLAAISIQDASVSILEQQKNQEKSEYLVKRQTNRGIYFSDSIGVDLISKLKSLESIAFPKANLWSQLTLINSDDKIKIISNFVKKYGKFEYIEKEVWKETYSWIRFGNSEIQGTNSGLPITHLTEVKSNRIQLLIKHILSPAMMRILKYIGIPQLLSKELSTLVRSAPLLVYFNFMETKPTVTEQLSGGALWLDFCIKATKLGLAVHPISVVLQHPKVYEKFLASFEFPVGKGFFFCRAGYPCLPASKDQRRIDLLEEMLIQ